MSEFLFKKSVDKSLLKAGMTIPKGIQQKLLSEIGISLFKGEKTKITVTLDGVDHEAILTNVNLSESNSEREVLQIRYSAKSSLGAVISQVFDVSFNTSKSKSGEESLPDYINVYSSGHLTLRFECFPLTLKENFLRYIGNEDSLSGYTRSYKLVFFKCFFEILTSVGEVTAESLTKCFKGFYLSRMKSGLIADKEVDSVIGNVESSSEQDVYKLILRNPFNVISNKGFILKTIKKDTEYFSLQHYLERLLTSVDISSLQNLISKKLDKYFEVVDSGKGIRTEMGLRDIADKLFNEYVTSSREPFTGHQMGDFFRNEIPQIIYKTGIVSSPNYKISGSVGQGTWAQVPWFAIFDREITTSASKGVYIVYLLSKNGDRLYLTLEQAGTEIRENNTRRETIRLLREKTSDIINRVDAKGFKTDENVNLGSNLTELADFYQKGVIFYKEYRKGFLPSENEMRTDLITMLEVYTDYAGNKQKVISDLENEQERWGEKELSVKDTIYYVKEYIASRGFQYDNSIIENFYLSLKSKPFVILAGISGTGKTRLVKLFAEALGANSLNGRYKMVAVRPDWSDSTDLFGHVDLNGKFIPGAIIEFIKTAELNNSKPYFLCLDEMNLARVEYYFSDVLSIIETRDVVNGSIVSESLIAEGIFGNDIHAAGKYGTVRLPENLYIIGTVNMDETTFPFSKKVLDRANTIEFSYVDLLPQFSRVENTSQQPINIDNEFLKAKYLLLTQCSNHQAFVEEVCLELQTINRLLKISESQVGYRVRDEIVFYMVNNLDTGLLQRDEALDNVILQKILPRLQGSNLSIKKMLCELFKHCARDYESYNTENDDISSRMFKAVKAPGCKYRKSAEKIAFMIRRYEEDGFTSFWL